MDTRIPLGPTLARKIASFQRDEPAAISLDVSAFSFGVGLVARAVFGLEV